MTLKGFIRDFNRAPVAAKSATVRPANITSVRSREDANQVLTTGLNRSKKSRV